MLADAKAGKLDVVVSVDLDRLLRTTRDLNVLIDAGLMAVTVDGELDLSTADGEFRATMLAGIARFEVRRKSERQTRANAQRAMAGRPPSGHRLTGYTRDGKPDPVEAPIVREIFQRFGAGDTISGIVADLNSRGIPPRRGDSWSRVTIRHMLQNPRYAGRPVYQGEVLGEVPATWEPMVSPDRFDAIQARLKDPRRKSNASGDTARKYLGSGLYLCGEPGCGKRVRSAGKSAGSHQYSCPDRHFLRTGTMIDRYVVGVVRGMLAREDFGELLTRPKDQSRLKELNAARADLVARIAVFEADYDAGLIDARRLKVATDKAQAEIAEVDKEREPLLKDTGLGEVLDAPDPVDAFDNASIDAQRRIVGYLVEVTLLRVPHGRPGFDPASVRLRWL